MPSEHEELLVRLIEFQDSHHFGKYRGLVSDIADEQHMLRIRAIVPAVFGDRQESPWAMPALPFAGPGHGLVVLPEIGDGVWIEFEGGDMARPIWSGCWWGADQLPAPAGTAAAPSERSRLLATTSGHQILVDEDADVIKIVHPGGAQITMSSDEITLGFGDTRSELKITKTEIKLNDGMVKVTATGASLVNDAMKFGA